MNNNRSTTSLNPIYRLDNSPSKNPPKPGWGPGAATHVNMRCGKGFQSHTLTCSWEHVEQRRLVNISPLKWFSPGSKEFLLLKLANVTPRRLLQPVSTSAARLIPDFTDRTLHTTGTQLNECIVAGWCCVH